MPNSSTPLVSIVIPAFNVEAYIERCIGSILKQTHHQLEIIVVNDCSTDRTGTVLDQLATTDRRLRVIHQQLNVGVHAARAIGTQVAQGSYLGFVDSDDWIDREMYAKLLEAMLQAQADIAICGVLRASEVGKTLGPKASFRIRRTSSEALLSRFCRMEFGTGVLWNKLYRTEIIRPWANVRLERKVDAAEDYIVNVGAFAAAARVVTLPGYYYYYFERPESASRVDSNAKNFCRLLRAYVACLETYSSVIEQSIPDIDTLYARQFLYNSYQIASPTELQPFSVELAESMKRFAQIHPTGIYPLIHAFDLNKPPDIPNFKRATKQFLTATEALARAVVRRPPSKNVHRPRPT